MTNLSPIILSTITLIDDIERKHDEIVQNLTDHERRDRDAVSLRDLLEELFVKNEELRRIHRGRRTIRRDVGSKKKKKKRSGKGKKSLRMKKN